ncbi:glycoside hydrolase family 2 protein [Carboxylicivirga marina]|uniref:Discoidin domain-containing protein n=1 Tax=Carboxylicivirga marina TaxID=2800988 RepID=A0ABS1HHE4_9BACT|nr:glycoside hydrolase family 2 TIM barrel-domain containing protein [Carboxylicivirga marina]MBK3517083.1 discoidin domain-containing protein [Carboxylicivirga marina]
MKNILFLLVISVLVVSCSNSKHVQKVRLKKNINRDWQFTFSSETEDFSDKNTDGHWERVGLPHTFSLPYFRSESFYEGYGWYQKALTIEKEWLNKRIYLEFDGVFQVAEIHLNGVKVGSHRGGYTGFEVDITDAVKLGENQLAIRVNNLWDAQLAPRAGEHVFSGGIYRDVYLTVTNPLHVTWNGTFVSTPGVLKNEAKVNLKTEIANQSESLKNITLKTLIVDTNGNEIAELSSDETIKTGDTMVCEQTSDVIKNPDLWSPSNPALYKALTFIYENDTLLDSYESSFGFRWTEWTDDEGFFLNGEHLYLEGVNVHQDHAGWGDAVTKAGVYRDLKLMKDAGFNLIRGSHYPHHPYFTEVCDQLGLLFIPENCVWGIGGFEEDGYWNSSTYPVHEEDMAAYNESAANTLQELIRINRNSPSVIAWSMSNEPFFSAMSVDAEMKQLLSDLVELSHILDPTRLAMIGGAQRRGVDVLGDIAGYNGDGATLYRNPGIPNMVSEYGSCVSDRPGNYTPCWGHVTDGEKPEWRSGHAIWCGFDHGSIAGNMGEMGIVDFARIPKRSWYWYRHYFRDIEPPVWPEPGTPKSLQLFADKTTIQGTNATDDVHINVKVIGDSGLHISNSPDVTLTIISGPGEFPTGRSITFKETTYNDIQILDGHAAIEFRSYEGGATIIEATSEGLESARINITTMGEPMYQEGITPLVKERPYIDYRLTKAIAAGEPVKVSDARPSRTNSAGKSLPSLANDGHKWTKWQPEPENGRVWWELDMENFYQVDRVEFTFVKAEGAELILETSFNQEDWMEVAKGRYMNNGQTEMVFNINDKTDVRFLRVSFFTNQTLVIGEIEVFGNVNR